MRLLLNLAFSLSLLSLASKAGEIKWLAVNGTDLKVSGRVHDEPNFNRLPASAKGKVRDAVWGLSTQTAGLAVRFVSNAPEIHIKYALTSQRANLGMHHMPSTGVSGFDLYRHDRDGKLVWVRSMKPRGKDTVLLADELNSIETSSDKPATYTLYLPLYNGVRSLEIGVGEKFAIMAAPEDKRKPIVAYGTSIAQGACASRPGLAWTNILSRKIDSPMINLGFSSNGRMETAVADEFLKVDASVYIIDCLPNLKPHQVKERTIPLIKHIRAKRPNTPILLVGAPPTNARWRASIKKHIDQESQFLKEAFEEASKTDKNLYLLEGKDLLGDDFEATVDGVHPNDIGMMRYAEAYTKKLKSILNNKHHLSVLSLKGL